MHRYNHANSNFCRLASVVSTAPNVQGWKGEDMLLRCDIKEEPLGVYWEKEEFLNPEQKTPKAQYLDGTFESLEKRFDIDKNFSLVITSLEVADEGRYYCHVLLKNSKSLGNSTIMTISSMASGHMIEECADGSQSPQSRCKYQPSSNTPSFRPTLTCVVSGFKPNVSMLWTEESGSRLNSVVSQQSTLSDGTNERLETITVSVKHGTEQTFMCIATGDSLNGTSTREITVLPSSVVGTAPNVQGWKGKDIVLRCDVKEEPDSMYWEKESFLNPEQKTRKAGYFDGNLKSLEERFDIDKNFSLIISSLEVADEGRYYCQVLLKNSQSFENSTIMTISTMASRHTIEECADRSQSRQSRCTYESPSNTPSLNLTCVVSGFKPNVSLLWTEELEKRLNSVVSRQNTLSDGTYERFETITVSTEHGTEQTFTCVATGDSLNGTSTREITVLPSSGKRVNSGLIIGLTIGVPVAIVILFLFVGKYLQSNHPDYLPRKDVAGIPAGEDQTYQRDFMRKTKPPSLTEEQIQQCKEELKEYYRMSRSKVMVDPLNFMERVELDDIYTNLSIIEQSSKRKTPITYDDLLTNNENGNLSKRLLIQGEGGVGKTTLCAKIVWDWCQGRILKDLDMVLLIPLRDIKNAASIGGIVKTYLSHSNTASKKTIDDYISTNLSRILIIFDGFDEFDEKLSKTSSSEVIRILRTEQYNSCKVIVTTRPWRTNEFMMDRSLVETYTFLNVEGFNKDNLSTYVRRYFRIREKDNLAKSLISFMQENDVIRSNMAPFPIYCAMLCLLWNDFSEERRREMQKLRTFSQIFGEMIFFLKEHYASKICENLQNQNIVKHLKKAGSAIHEISEIALEGLFHRNLSFPEKQFRKCSDAMKTCCRVGVLTKEKNVITRERRRDVNISSLVTSTVSFPHKLFQEYIAGVYIEYLFDNDRAKYAKVKNELFSRRKEFRYVLYFTSATGNELGLDIIKRLIKNEKRDFCVNVAFECHTEEAARAVGEQWHEYKLPSYASEHTVSGVVFMVRYSQVQSLDIIEKKCGRTVSRDLAEGMCSSNLLRRVWLCDSQFHLEFYKILRAEASNCLIEDLNISLSSRNDDILSQSSVGEDLAKWVCAMPRLSRFTLKCPYLPNSFFSTAATLASSCKIEDLNISLSSRNDDILSQSSVGEDLAKWVCAMPRLSRFTLKCPYLPNSFFSTAATLASSCKIEDLNISLSSRNDDILSQSSVGEDLAKWVCAMPRLSRFTLKCPYLPNSFFSTAATLASSCKIEDLDLRLDDDDIVKLSSMGEDFAQWVCTMPRLSKFKLKCAYLTDSFLSTAATLASSCQISEFSISNPHVMTAFLSKSAAAKLAEFLCRLPNLTCASITRFNLPETFFKTIASKASRCRVKRISIDDKPQSVTETAQKATTAAKMTRPEGAAEMYDSLSNLGAQLLRMNEQRSFGRRRENTEEMSPFLRHPGVLLLVNDRRPFRRSDLAEEIHSSLHHTFRFASVFKDHAPADYTKNDHENGYHAADDDASC
ncbi:uncharacterized protein [Diadema setosum]|uniref:uncharacterized protein n=1 Tax=Diadema setosum TaxID=31175 RepID=UPI003B3A2CCA